MQGQVRHDGCISLIFEAKPQRAVGARRTSSYLE